MSARSSGISSGLESQVGAGSTFFFTAKPEVQGDQSTRTPLGSRNQPARKEFSDSTAYILRVGQHGDLAGTIQSRKPSKAAISSIRLLVVHQHFPILG
jgi:hypothetical protein